MKIDIHDVGLAIGATVIVGTHVHVLATSKRLDPHAAVNLAACVLVANFLWTKHFRSRLP